MLKCVPLPLLHICVGQNSEAKIFHLKREQTSFLIQKKSRAVHLKLVSPTLLLFIFTPVTTLHILSVQPSNLALLALQIKNNLQNALLVRGTQLEETAAILKIVMFALNTTQYLTKH